MSGLTPPGAQEEAGLYSPSHGEPAGSPVPRRWLVVAIVAAVVAVAAAIAIVLSLVGGDDGEDGSASTSSERAVTTTSAATTEPDDGPSSTSSTTTAETSTSGAGLSADEQARIAEVKQFVATERGLPFQQDVPVEFLADDEFLQLLDELNAEAQAEAEPDEAANFDKFYRALHLVEEGESAEELFEKAYDEGIIGVYLPEKDRMVVRGDDLDLYATSTLVHELVHALDDQHFDLDRPEYDDRVDDEISFGFTSLVEGNAVRVQEAWEAQLSEDDKEQLADEESEYAESIDLDGIPQSVLAVAGLPYELGPLFVGTLLEDGGQPTVDAAFADPPVTSEQVVFGDLYLDGEAATPVGDPAAAAATWERGVFGLAGFLVVLFDAEIQPAEGVFRWGGDRYVAYDDPATGNPCVAISVTGDSGSATDAYESALGEWATQHGNATVSREGDLVNLVACA